MQRQSCTHINNVVQHPVLRDGCKNRLVVGSSVDGRHSIYPRDLEAFINVGGENAVCPGLAVQALEEDELPSIFTREENVQRRRQKQSDL